MKTLLAFGLGILLGGAPTMAIADGFGLDDPDAIVGTWLTHEDNAHVEISSCDDRYCGRITWVGNGNPDTIGFLILDGFTFDGEDAWKDGKLRSPADGRSGDATLELGDDGVLRVKVRAGLRGRTLEWTRVTDGGGDRLMPQVTP
jgi:uncharacterized protein (DUF2147 family)